MKIFTYSQDCVSLDSIENSLPVTASSAVSSVMAVAAALFLIAHTELLVALYSFLLPELWPSLVLFLNMLEF